VAAAGDDTELATSATMDEEDVALAFDDDFDPVVVQQDVLARIPTTGRKTS